MPNASKDKNSKDQFGVRNGLLIEKELTEKMGVLVLPQIHFKKIQSLGFWLIYVKRRGNGRDKK